MKNTNSNSFIASDESLKDLISETLHIASKLGASQAEAGLSIAEGMSVSARMRNVETLEYQKDNGLGISVYFGQHKGTASTSSLNKESIQKTVEAACNIAKFTSEDDCAGLADANLMATQFAELDLYHPWEIDSEKAIQLALECEASALDHDDAIVNSDGAAVDFNESYAVYGNSHGFLQSRQKTRQSISCSVVAENDKGMQRDYWYSVARNPDLLEKVNQIGVKAAQRTIDRLGATKIKTGKYSVMYSPDVAQGIIGHFNSAISGNAQYRKASFLLDAIDSKVFPDFIQLYEQPFLKQSMGAANFDSEGVATTDHKLVIDGIVQSYLLDSYSARKLGRSTTGHASGVHNLAVKDTGKDFSQCLQAMDKGLLVTELMGQGVSTVTGDYSRGAAGFWVENGVIQYPVEEITIASNLKDMFNNIVEIGNDVDKRGNIHCGSIIIENMTVAGEQ